MNVQIEGLESRQFLSTTAPNIAPSASRLIFTQPMNSTSHAQYLTLTNKGSAALALNSISVTGADAAQFSVRRKGIPASLKAGASTTLKLTFTPTTAAVVSGSALNIASDDPDAPVLSITLRGLGTGGLFNSAEPSLQRILDTLQIPVNVGDTTPTTSHLDGPGGASEEIPMQLLKKAGPGLVRITPLAAFSWDFAPVAHFGWFRARGPVVTRELFNIPGGNAQTILPTSSGTTTFDPGSVNFGLYSNWPVEQHGSVFTQDALNTWDTTTDNKHKVRFYPYRKASGKTVPNTYVMAIEQAFNSDFQDAVLVIENVQPYNAVIAPINLAAAAASSSSVHLTWTDNNDYESSYIIERSRSKNGTFSVIGTTGAGVSSFDDAHLASNTLYYYRVRAANVTGSSAPSLRAVARTAV